MTFEQIRVSQNKRQSGFSLIELIVVITIIGILATTVVVSTAGRTDQAKVATTKAAIKAVIDASRMYKIDIGRYPESIEDLLNPPEGDMKTYLENDPIDPWTKEPIYFELTDDGVLAYSYGADMEEGGEGMNADIRSDDMGNRR